jgi:ABC-2 type transport system ATP-binding protein
MELRFADGATLAAAADALGRPLPDGDDLSLRIPSDGNVATLRGVLRALDDADLDVADLAVHTPDLDDVFLELTR